ncbi:MAG: DUF1800 family protein [Granulosicoccus sp.]
MLDTVVTCFRPLVALALAFVVTTTTSVASTRSGSNLGAHLNAIISTEDARHLLMRTGVGARPEDILALRGLSRKQAIDDIIDGISVTPDVPMPDWVSRPLPLYHARPDMDDEARAKFSNERDAELAQLRQWWVLNILQTSSPQTERMVLFWHDLFATNYHSLGKQSLAMARQNQTFRSLGFGSWERLIKAMIRDAALLEFLDSGSNHKTSPNENLARELMELFVLGEGNYDEMTVREAARSLTGHDTSRFHDLQFWLKTWAQDREDKRLFGQTGAFDGDALVELLLQQEAAPKFLATKFWYAFVSDVMPDPAWIDDQARLFRQSDLDIATLYRNVLQSKAFWHADNRGAMIKSPVDIVAGTARTLDYPMSQWQRMPQWQKLIGMDVFAPPNVSGWKEGAAFITPGHLLNRYKVVRQLIRAPAGKTQQNHSDTQMSAAAMQNVIDTDSSQGMSVVQEPSGSDMMSPDNPMQPVSAKPESNVIARLAAEDFHGPAQYRISLMKDSQLLWESNARSFTAGRDTLMFGRIENYADLAWKNETIVIPDAKLTGATALRLHFLNDAAGADGDRNLFVDGVRIGKHWLSAASAEQSSTCVPDLSANAGRLYCGGYVEFDLSTRDRKPHDARLPDTGNAPLRASAIHIQRGGINKNNGNANLAMVLDHLQTPGKDFQHVLFIVEKKNNQPMMLKLDSFHCWPDCIDPWPECAWTDKNFTANKHIAMPWVALDNERWSAKYDHQCQFESLSTNEKNLVSTLWVELPYLLAKARKTLRVKANGERWLPLISLMETQYRQAVQQMPDTAYTPFAKALDISSDYAPGDPEQQSLSAPVTRIDDVATLMDELSAQDMLIHELLLPQLSSDNIPGLPRSDAKRPGRYLKAVLEHPLFQLK